MRVIFPMCVIIMALVSVGFMAGVIVIVAHYGNSTKAGRYRGWVKRVRAYGIVLRMDGIKARKRDKDHSINCGSSWSKHTGNGKRRVVMHIK